MKPGISILAILLFAVPPLCSQAGPGSFVRSVRVEGNLRVPAETVLHHVSAAPGKVFRETQAGSDLRRLYDLGIFQSLEIRTEDAGEGWMDVIYRVVEHPFVSDFCIQGLSAGEEERVRGVLLDEKLLLPTTAPYHPEAANKAALVIRNYLRSHNYPLAEVDVSAEAEEESNVRVSLRVRTGPRLEIGEVRFRGNHSIPAGELQEQLQHIRPAPLLARWGARRAYTPESVAADLESLRRYYRSQGFAAVRIGEPQAVARDFSRRWWHSFPGMPGSSVKLSIVIPVTEGPRFRLLSVDHEGDAGFSTFEVSQIIASVKVPARYDFSFLEELRQKVLDALGHGGHALAHVQLEQEICEPDHTVRAHFFIEAGDPVAVGRIQFQGNTHVRSDLLRRELVLSEGAIYDVDRLDESILRLNRSGMIEQLRRSDVLLELNEDTQRLDITIRVKEKKRQGVYATGGSGGISGGYLGILYSAFDLFGFGESLSLQLDGGVSQSNTLLNIVGRRFLGSPFTLGLSAFHRVTRINIAGIVPDSTDLVSLFRHRSTGAGLSGSYEVSSRMQIGIGGQFAGISLSQYADGAGGEAQSEIQRRMEVTPFLSYDATRGNGPGTRGGRFSAAGSWEGTGFLQSVDTISGYFSHSQYLADPFTGGKNSFAIRFQAAFARPRGPRPLRTDQLLFPGEEVARGFPSGGLTPWAHPAGADQFPVPTGADTVLGFSAEYRIPIQGPLSAAAFFDLGWSGLSRNRVERETGSRLIDVSNRLMRGSAGGELRLQLPVIHQPGRLIFSWNPLRLDSLVHGASSSLRLADPRRSIRFALGGLY